MKLYIYPTFNPQKDTGGNMYIKNFHESFTKLKSQYVLKNRFWKVGIASIFFNLDAKVFIIHWVDKIPFKRMGKIQFYFFSFCNFYTKIAKEKNNLGIT